MLSTLLALAFVGSPIAAASVQTPTLTPCSSNQNIRVNDVRISNARIGQKMTVNFTFINSEPLGSNPTLQVTMRKPSGNKVPCYSNVGSCTYKLCNGTTTAEQYLAQRWNNECPVPAITTQESIEAKLVPQIQFLIGYAPTTLDAELKVVNGSTTVGCQSFKVMIEAA